MSGIRERLSSLLDIPGLEAEEARRRKLLNVMLLAIAASAILTLLVLIIVIPLGLTGEQSEVWSLRLTVAVAFFGVGVIYALNRYVSGELTSALFVLFLIALAVISDEPQQVIDGRGLLVFAIPILVASVLLRPWASFVAAAACSVVVIVISLVVVPRLMPNVLVIVGFIVLALLSWLSAHSLEQALQNVRTINRRLQESEDRLRTAGKAAYDLIYEWDVATDSLRWFGDIDELLGYRKGDISRDITAWLELIHPEDRDGLTDAVELHRTSSEPIRYEYRVRHRDGTWRYWSDHGLPLLDHEGRPFRWIGVCTDITGIIEAQEQLRESERRLIAAQHMAKIGDFTWDVASGEVTWSEALYDLLRYDRSEEIDLSRVNTDIHHPDDRDRVVQWLNDCVASGSNELTPNEYRIIRKDGGVIHVRTVGVIERAEGRSPRVFATLQDITERKRAEEERARLEEQFHGAQRLESIGRLAGGVAHDLNNLLTPIIGYSEMLLAGIAGSDTNRERVKEIVKASLRARDLVGQLLAFSRKQVLEFTPLDLNALLQGYIRLLRRTIREDIAIRLVPAGSLPPIRGDAGQLEQVVMNLAVNAQDAMPDGGVLTIETALAELDEGYAAEHKGVTPGSYVMLAVSDTGHGMDANILEHIFEPFFTTKGKNAGTGLGLATVYGIIKQHDGNIWAYSEPGRGATFKIYLPVSAEPSVPQALAEVAPEGLAGAETILLVEDNKQVRNLAQMVLEQKGYTVLSLESGKDALAQLERFDGPVHLLLTDVIMPEMNGRQLFEQVSARYPEVRVLYMSGYTDDVIAHHGVIDPNVHFIQKPFSLNSLAAKVREVLDQ